MSIYQKIKRKAREKFFTLSDSPISRVTLYDWEKNGLPNPIKKFFEICEFCDLDPLETYQEILKFEQERTT